MTRRLEELETLMVDKVKERLRRSSLPPSERDDFSIDANDVPSRAVSQEPFAWVSQPGMIRTYGAGLSFAEAFPLYSTSGAEVMTTAEELDQEFEKMRAWDQMPSRFVNLNAATVNGGERQFPILNDSFDRRKYPEGFRVTSPRPWGRGDVDDFPMPVEWIYVLADGSEGTLGPEGTYVGRGEVSDANPMIARYAYWTDDESTKINLNTASEGIPWETPTIQSAIDKANAAFPPVTNEVQRYPGHPAKTCLSSLFYPNLYVDAQGELALPGEALMDLYEIALQITPVEPLPFEEASSVTFDEDSVYESLTDFHQRHPEKGTGYDGFLTTTSVAPETSVHGRPRTSLWPLHVNVGEAYRSEYDESVSQRTTLSGRSYHVLRERSESAYHDFYTVGDRSNVALFRYLMDQVYRPLPTMGGSLAKKYGATSEGFDYLSGHRDNSLDHVRLPFQMLDFIRSTNLIDRRLEVPFAVKNASTGSGQVMPLSMLSKDLNSGDGVSEHAEKIFSAYAGPKGHGRDLMISEVSLVLYVTAEATLRGI